MAWDCGACGKANEDHALFCGACAGGRSRIEPVRWTFALWWAAVTTMTQVALGATLGLALSWLKAGTSPAVYAAVFVALREGIVAGAQVGVLARHVPWRPWVAWVPVTCAAWVVAALIARFLPDDPSFAQETLEVALTGGVAGAVQAGLLRRRLPGPPWWIWIMLNVVAAVVMMVTFRIQLPKTYDGPQVVFVARLYLFSVVPANILTGVGLAWLLRRAGRPAEGG